MTAKLAFVALLFAATTTSAFAQASASTVMPKDKTQASPRLNPVQARADRLSSKMTRDLRLNNYQANRLRAINEEKIAKMAAIEQRNAGNAKLVDEQCNGVCKERDQELRAVLSNDQYSSYYGARSAYYRYDKDYAHQAAGALLTSSVQNPAPSRANDAVIAPTADKPSRPVGNLGRNAR
jgi:hypothetical protein